MGSGKCQGIWACGQLQGEHEGGSSKEEGVSSGGGERQGRKKESAAQGLACRSRGSRRVRTFFISLMWSLSFGFSEEWSRVRAMHSGKGEREREEGRERGNLEERVGERVGGHHHVELA